MRKTSIAVAFGAAIMLALTACGGSTPGESTPGESAPSGETTELTTLKIGLVPVSAVAPIYLGIEKGFFEEEGLELEIVKGIGGPSAIAAVQSQSVDVAIAAPDTMIQTSSKGLPFRAIAGAGSLPADGTGGSQVVAPANSDIQSVADLEGKTIGTFILQGANELNVRAAINAKGADASTIKFVNLEFAAIPGALERGDIAAGVLAEPILSQALASGEVRVILDYYPVIFPNGTNITLWFTGLDQLDKNRDALERFRTALEKSAKYADENTDEVRRILPEFSGISAEDAATVPLQVFSMPLSQETYEKTVEIMKEFETLDKDYTLNFSEMIMQ